MGEAPPRSGAAWVAAGIFLSRLLGLVRERVFAHYFGNSLLADAWRAGLRLPAVIQNILGEGSLSASFIPVYVRLIAAGKDEEAGKVAGAVLGLLIAMAGAFALAGALLAPVLVAILLPGYVDDVRGDVTVTLLRLLFPMMGILTVSAWTLGVLNSHRRFFVSYVAPVFWNVAILGALLGGGMLFGREGRGLLEIAGWGALLGGALQFGFQVPFVIRYMTGVRISFDYAHTRVREVISNFVPVVAARGAVNLSSLLDGFLASFLGIGALSLIGYSLTLYILPISLFGMSIAASELPELSRDDLAAKSFVAARAGRALDRVLFWMIPSAVGYVLFGDLVMSAVFGTGQFGPDDAVAGGLVLAAYAIGLPASGAARVMSSTFFAIQDTRTPARFAYMRIALSALVGAGLMFPMDGIRVGDLGLGAAGLALGATVGAWLECGLLVTAARSRLGALGLSGGRMARMLGAVVVASLAGLVVESTVRGAPGPVGEVGTVGAFGVAYLALGVVLGVAPWSPRSRPPPDLGSDSNQE